MIDNMLLILSTDTDKAIEIYNQYMHSIGIIKEKNNQIDKSLSDIESSINRAKNWKSEVDKLSSKFKEAGGDQPKLISMIDDLENLSSESQIWGPSNFVEIVNHLDHT